MLEPCFGIPPSICQDHGAIILAGGNTKVDGSIDGITEEVRSKIEKIENVVNCVTIIVVIIVIVIVLT